MFLLDTECCEAVSGQHCGHRSGDGQQIGKKVLRYIYMAQDRLVAGLCESGNEPAGSMKCGTLLGCCISTVFLGVKWLVGCLVGWLVG